MGERRSHPILGQEWLIVMEMVYAPKEIHDVGPAFSDYLTFSGRSQRWFWTWAIQLFTVTAHVWPSHWDAIVISTWKWSARWSGHLFKGAQVLYIKVLCSVKNNSAILLPACNDLKSALVSNQHVQPSLNPSHPLHRLPYPIPKILEQLLLLQCWSVTLIFMASMTDVWSSYSPL